eukprot:403334594
MKVKPVVDVTIPKSFQNSPLYTKSKRIQNEEGQQRQRFQSVTRDRQSTTAFGSASPRSEFECQQNQLQFSNNQRQNSQPKTFKFKLTTSKDIVVTNRFRKLGNAKQTIQQEIVNQFQQNGV